MACDKTSTHDPVGTSGQAQRARSEVIVARRYLAHGFLDAALRLFGRNIGHVTANDWSLLANGFLQHRRVEAAVCVCELGGLPLPRQELLALGDRYLRLKDVDSAIHYYELADADHERWSGLIDVLTRLPGRERRAIAVVERHLVAATASVVSRRAAAVA